LARPGDKANDLRFATGLPLVSVVQAEASRAAGSLPLAFLKKQDSL
jgi:hypothetical protein